MSNAHVTEQLPALLTGEASREVVLAAARHLRGCLDCQQELVSALTAHAALRSARRFAPEIVGVSAEVEPDPEPPVPPDLTAVFAQVREEAQAARPTRRFATRRSRYLLVAAAAAVLIGGGSAAIVIATSGNSTSTGRTVRLAAYDTGTTPATAHLGAGRMTIDAATLPQLAGRRYEVWLTNNHRTQMQPIGWIDANGHATLTVPADLMNRFNDIEVSVQQLSAPSYDYSGTSVLRGAYR